MRDMGLVTASLTLTNKHPDLTNGASWLKEGEYCPLRSGCTRAFLAGVVLVPFLHLPWGMVQLLGSMDTGASPDTLAIDCALGSAAC